MTDELTKYLEHPYTPALDPAVADWPLDDEPHVAVWQAYASEAEREGTFTALRRIFPQLRVAVREGISETPEYRAATRRGDFSGLDSLGAGLALERPDDLTLGFSGGAAGRLPVLTAGTRSDFVTLVQALTERNEPGKVPPAMGAAFVKGLTNWDRVARYRAAWEKTAGTGGDEDAWREEMARFSANKALYQDRLVILSRGPYSGISAQDAGLSGEVWLDRSVVIRREHELTHYLTWRLYGVMRMHVTDEIVADFSGLVAAFGRYREDLARRFLGLERFPPYRKGARLEQDRSALSPSSFTEVARLSERAIRQVGRLSDRRAADLADPLRLARLTWALATAPLDELASETLPDRIDQRLN